MHMIFDAHCDTSDVLYENNAELKKNNFHIDLNRMKEYKNYIQVFAAYIDKKNITCSPMNRCIALIEKITTELESDPFLLYTADDVLLPYKSFRYIHL